jgi:hypothetical protein
MRKYIFICIGIFILSSCQETFYPDVEESDPVLVIDGMLCTKPEKSRVIVTYSCSFSKRIYNGPVDDLVIYALDTLGNRIDFIENSNTGVYFTVKDESQAAMIGNKYTLFIETTDGDVYKSSLQVVTECPGIETLYIKAETKTTLTEDAYGDIMEVDSKGASVYTDTKGILPEKNYYLYRWYGYEEHQSTVGIPGSPSSAVYKHQHISSLFTSIIHTGNADKIYNKILKQNKLVFIPNYTYLSYAPILPASYQMYKDLFQGYILISDQLSLSEDAYLFWKAAEDQLAASGKIFDPVSSQIKGNMTCVNKPDKLMLGVFYATDSKRRYDYLYINSKNKIYCRQLDSLPEICSDTITPSMPEGWIFPPF